MSPIEPFQASPVYPKAVPWFLSIRSKSQGSKTSFQICHIVLLAVMCNVVSPEIERNHRSRTNSSVLQPISNTEKTVSRQKNYRGRESCMLVMPELSKTMRGTLAICWILYREGAGITVDANSKFF
jgi:hypothetical protein